MNAENYAVINSETGIIENMVVWDGEPGWSPPAGYTAINSIGNATIGWSYSGGVFYAPDTPGATDDELARAARQHRDWLLRNICDPGILMAQRALRMATSPEETAYAESKIAELDIYALALQGIPEQAGFPISIEWPAEPAA